MSATARRSAGNDKPGRVVTAWRTAQRLDADQWRDLRDQAPLRFARWFAALGIAIGTWIGLGTPKSATAFLPALAIVVLLVLPDAASISLAGFTWQARQVNAELKETTEKAQEALVTASAGTQAGGVAVDSAQARSEPATPALDALSRFLPGEAPWTAGHDGE